MQSDQKLKIALVFDDTLDSSDGVSQYVKAVGGWLSAQGHEVIYLVGETRLTSWSGAPIYSLSKNLTVSFNHNRVRTPLHANKKRLIEVLRKHKPDILHVQVPYSPFMAGRVIRAAHPKTNIVGTFHVYPAGFVACFGTRLLKLFCLRTLKRFTAILSVSAAAAEFAGWAFGLKTIASSNVVELRKYAMAENRQPKKRIVFLGRLVKRKGCEELLRAFILLRSSVPEATLVIAGDGPERQKLQRLVNQNDLGPSVSFLGFIDEKDKPALLASGDIACFPSLYGESFGIVLIEAMAAGAGVVVGGNNPGYASVLGEKSRALVDPGDSSAFAACLEKFLTDEHLAASVHAWQKEHVKRYDVDVVGPRLVEVYREAIAKQRSLSDN